MNTNTIANVFGLLSSNVKSQGSASRAQVVQLAGRDVANLGKTACVLTAKSGVAWVTADGIDHVLRSGETLKQPAIISSANRGGVAVEIRR